MLFRSTLLSSVDVSTGFTASWLEIIFEHSRLLAQNEGVCNGNKKEKQSKILVGPADRYLYGSDNGGRVSLCVFFAGRSHEPGNSKCSDSF